MKVLALNCRIQQSQSLPLRVRRLLAFRPLTAAAAGDGTLELSKLGRDPSPGSQWIGSPARKQAHKPHASAVEINIYWGQERVLLIRRSVIAASAIEGLLAFTAGRLTFCVRRVCPVLMLSESLCARRNLAAGVWTWKARWTFSLGNYTSIENTRLMRQSR